MLFGGMGGAQTEPRTTIYDHICMRVCIYIYMYIWVCVFAPYFEDLGAKTHNR